MNETWPRGAEWRKWDLHLHSPGTKLNDQFKFKKRNLWEKYCKKLYNSDVQAFGITDYFSADGYFNTSNEFGNRYPNSGKVFFPNVELRTGDVVNTSQEEVNIHLIFNPFQPNFKSEIRGFLQSLKTNKTKGDGGRHIKASELSEKRHFEEATTTREFIHEALTDTYGRGADLLDYLLIITAANNDGIRPERGKKRKLLITDELDKFSDGFFGNAGNVKYFLSCNRAEDKTEHTSPKPVLSGCDAHSYFELNERLGKVVSDSYGIFLEPTWIKSDLTFEGLKQIIFEPQNRVYIGKEPEIERRVRENKTKYINALHITNIDGYKGQHGTWFSEEQILLGKELNAIIGNKGNGKSAVTDIIGLLGNSHNQTYNNPKRKSEELFSFLSKEKFLKRRCAKNFTGRLVWYEGESDWKPLDAEVSKNLPEKVEYLPQKYLERICADIADDEFRTTLNKVIFRYVKPQQRYGQNSLDALIKYLTSQADEDIQKSKHDLHQINDKVVATEKKLTQSYLKEIKERIRLKREELDAHQNAAPVAKPKPPDKSADATTAETKEIENFTRQIATCNETIDRLQNEQVDVAKFAEELRQIKQAIRREAESLSKLKSRYQAILESIGLAFEDIVNLTLDYSLLDALVTEKEERLVEIDNLLITEEEIFEKFGEGTEVREDCTKAASTSIVCQKASIENQKAKLVERLAKPVREHQVYLNEFSIWNDQKKEICGDEQNPAADSLRGLQMELANIETIFPKNLQDERAEQARISKEIFQKKRNLTGFYDTIKQSIDTEIKKNRDDLHDYTISIEAGLRFDLSFIDTFLKFINQNVRGSFHGVEEGRAMIQAFCDIVDNWENETEVFDTLEVIVDSLHTDKREGIAPGENKSRDVFKQMKNQNTPVIDLYDYLFGFDYLKTKYDLNVDKKDLSELSPGERGGLLLIFYLMLDRQDTPLVIDQPEDNLDNKSVYEILVTFIKQAKKRRQIILVTHNPNLAVVADAEQIIHVSIDKKFGKHEFDFFSGSIENPQINQVVVDILEGTLPAFDNRRLKYRRQN